MVDGGGCGNVWWLLWQMVVMYGGYGGEWWRWWISVLVLVVYGGGGAGGQMDRWIDDR